MNKRTREVDLMSTNDQVTLNSEKRRNVFISGEEEKRNTLNGHIKQFARE